MSKRKRGGYHGGSSIIRVGVGLLLERTEKKRAKVQRERERLAAEQEAFERNQTATLIRADSPESRKRLLKHKNDQERAKHHDERIAEHAARRDERIAERARRRDERIAERAKRRDRTSES
jgi:Arc/MetJ-type ribon-helix-helix transcriptional regulator